MCGIFGYTGKNNATDVLLDGLSALEYRGYDSAGLFVAGTGAIKTVGAASNLRPKVPISFKGETGIAHLRWATHGEPTELNAHPHSDCKENIWVVHNGIIENHQELRKRLILLGHTFRSETDTEVLSHLVEHYLDIYNDFEKAAISAIKEIRGTYGVVIVCDQQPEKLIAARMGAPVVLGLGDGENFIASDPSPILRHTKNVIFLNDGEIAIITATSHRLLTLDNKLIERGAEILDEAPEEIQKGNHESFMLKEIMEGPEVVHNTLRGRLIIEEGLAKLGGIEMITDRLREIKRIVIIGCGTAYYAGLVGEYMLEEYGGIPTEVEIGSEFRYRKPLVDAETLVIAISQSGETADTLEAIREAKRKGALTMGIVNTVGSTIARETEAGIYNHAGPEIGVASTKAFISQLVALVLLTLFLGRQRSMSLTMGKRIATELLDIPEKIKKILEQHSAIEEIAQRYAGFRDFLFLGRKYNYPIAFEGALKLKEISYIHAEGCGAGEMKHGPLAMINPDFPTLAIAPRDSVYEKMVSNIEEIKARKGKIIAITTEGNDDLHRLVNEVLYIPKTLEMLSPILTTIPLQLFAYSIARIKQLDVDRPRNLAKSVTVE